MRDPQGSNDFLDREGGPTRQFWNVDQSSGRNIMSRSAPRAAFSDMVAPVASSSAQPADAGQPPALAVDDLSVSFGGRRIVKGLSFTVSEGQILTIVGPSGSGKTTILRAIAGLLNLNPDCRLGGRIQVGGADMTETLPERRPISLLFQGYALFPHLTVEENILFGPRMHRVPRAEAHRRAAALLALVGLSEAANLHPPQLSGGMQQRVALARALATQPSILLLDEPLSALDRILQLDLEKELLHWLRSTGTTALFVTHDQQQALSLGDRIIVLGDRAQILQSGPPRCVYEMPISVDVAKFLGAANLITVAIDGDDSGVPLITLGGSPVRCTFATEAVRHGSSAIALIRPEWLHLASKTSVQALSAEVRASLFRGDHAVVTVCFPELATPLTARLPPIDFESTSITLSLSHPPILYPLPLT
jgi:ABC-type Fe3+/spermidine/putrescine transport system ATPase subunit